MDMKKLLLIAFIVQISIISICGMASPHNKNTVTDISRLKYQRGGFHNGYTTIVIDFPRKIFQKSHITSPNLGADTILSRKELEEWLKNYSSHGKIMQQKLTCKEIETLLNTLNKNKVAKWKKKYTAPDIEDGESWKIQILYANGEQFSTFGLSEYPHNWEEVSKAIENAAKL